MNLGARIRLLSLGPLCLAGCDGGDDVPGRATDAGTVEDASPDGGAGSLGCEALGADTAIPADAGYAATCDLSGIWIARQTTEALALRTPQYASTWYYFELTQRGSELEVTRHMDCGIEVQGTVTVKLTPETTASLRHRNSQVGRKGQVAPLADGTCALAIERFWSVRGVSEQRYAPTPRTRDVTLEALSRERPLPPFDMPALTEDWDGDGHPGIAWNISGIVLGTRHSAQRDWTRYFTAPGYTIAAAEDFRDDLVVRAAYGVEEVVYEPENLRQTAQASCAAPHTLTMRFLGRTREDARAVELLAADDATTCANVRAALPAPQGFR